MNCSKHDRKPKSGAQRRKTTVADLDKQLEKMNEAQRLRLRRRVLDVIEHGFESLEDVEQSAMWLRELRDDINVKLVALDEQIQWAKEHG